MQLLVKLITHQFLGGGAIFMFDVLAMTPQLKKNQRIINSMRFSFFWVKLLTHANEKIQDMIDGK